MQVNSVYRWDSRPSDRCSRRISTPTHWCLFSAAFGGIEGTLPPALAPHPLQNPRISYASFLRRPKSQNILCFLPEAHKIPEYLVLLLPTLIDSSFTHPLLSPSPPPPPVPSVPIKKYEWVRRFSPLPEHPHARRKTDSNLPFVYDWMPNLPAAGKYR